MIAGVLRGADGAAGERTVFIIKVNTHIRTTKAHYSLNVIERAFELTEHGASARVECQYSERQNILTTLHYYK